MAWVGRYSLRNPHPLAPNPDGARRAADPCGHYSLTSGLTALLLPRQCFPNDRDLLVEVGMFPGLRKHQPSMGLAERKRCLIAYADGTPWLVFAWHYGVGPTPGSLVGEQGTQHVNV